MDGVGKPWYGDFCTMAKRIPQYADPTLVAACDRVRAYYAEAKMTGYAIAKATGMHHQAVYRMFESDWHPQPKTLERLLAAIPDDWQPKPKPRRRRDERRPAAAE